MVPAAPDLTALIRMAERDLDSVVELTRRLVQAPSRGGIDPYEPVLDLTRDWLRDRGLPARVLTDPGGAPVALCCDVGGARPGPRWVLNACLDTAPFGDPSAWSHPPTSAHVADGWLWGRGSADSKAGVAIFCHVAARVAPLVDHLRGSLTLLFDVDEHTGRFGGAVRYIAGPDAPTDVAGVMIGYPGPDTLVVGGRGVLRARLRLHGVASHSGARRATPNAVEKAARLVTDLAATALPQIVTPDFPLPPKLTITRIDGGESFSTTPDTCAVDVDVRTTPAFDGRQARRLLDVVASSVDAAWPGTRPTTVDIRSEWPPYHTAAGTPVRRALLRAVEQLGRAVEPKISGMSNIGNYFAGLGIPATAGFGVEYQGLHATDERIRLDGIPVAQAAYHLAVLDLLTSDPPSGRERRGP